MEVDELGARLELPLVFEVFELDGEIVHEVCDWVCTCSFNFYTEVEDVGRDPQSKYAGQSTKASLLC